MNRDNFTLATSIDHLSTTSASEDYYDDSIDDSSSSLLSQSSNRNRQKKTKREQRCRCKYMNVKYKRTDALSLWHQQ